MNFTELTDRIGVYNLTKCPHTFGSVKVLPQNFSITDLSTLSQMKQCNVPIISELETNYPQIFIRYPGDGTIL